MLDLLNRSLDWKTSTMENEEYWLTYKGKNGDKVVELVAATGATTNFTTNSNYFPINARAPSHIQQPPYTSHHKVLEGLRMQRLIDLQVIFAFSCSIVPASIIRGASSAIFLDQNSSPEAISCF